MHAAGGGRWNRAFRPSSRWNGTQGGRMRRIRFAPILIVAGLALAAAPAVALAGHAASTCTGTLASGKYKKLIVPAGAKCDGTEATVDVRGGVRVGEGATFILGSEEGGATGTIRGGIRANGPAS